MRSALVSARGVKNELYACALVEYLGCWKKRLRSYMIHKRRVFGATDLRKGTSNVFCFVAVVRNRHRQRELCCKTSWEISGQLEDNSPRTISPRIY